MSVSAETLRSHIDYTAWASGLLLESARQLSSEELNRDFGTADKSVLGTLVHIFAGDRIWLERMQGVSRAALVDPGDHDFAVLQQAWPAASTLRSAREACRPRASTCTSRATAS